MRIGQATDFPARRLGLLGFAAIEPFTMRASIDAIWTLWNRPMQPRDFWIHHNFRYRRACGSEKDLVGDSPLVCVDISTKPLGIPMIGIWWSQPYDPVEAANWIRRRCSHPIVPFGDGQMFTSTEDVAAYDAQFVGYQVS